MEMPWAKASLQNNSFLCYEPQQAWVKNTRDDSSHSTSRFGASYGSPGPEQSVALLLVPENSILSIWIWASKTRAKCECTEVRFKPA